MNKLCGVIECSFDNGGGETETSQIGLDICGADLIVDCCKPMSDGGWVYTEEVVALLKDYIKWYAVICCL